MSIERPTEICDANRSLWGICSGGVSRWYALTWRSDRVIVSRFNPDREEIGSKSSPGYSTSVGNSNSAWSLLPPIEVPSTW
jgi:hypothetical protein